MLPDMYTISLEYHTYILGKALMSVLELYITYIRSCNIICINSVVNFETGWPSTTSINKWSLIFN